MWDITEFRAGIEKARLQHTRLPARFVTLIKIIAEAWVRRNLDGELMNPCNRGRENEKVSICILAVYFVDNLTSTLGCRLQLSLRPINSAAHMDVYVVNVLGMALLFFLLRSMLFLLSHMDIIAPNMAVLWKQGLGFLTMSHLFLF